MRASPNSVVDKPAVGSILERLTVLMKRQQHQISQGVGSAGEVREATQRSLPSEMNQLIRDFEESEQPGAAEAWIGELDNFRTMYGWSMPVAYTAASFHLKGAARKWFLANSETIRDYDQLITEFRKVFTKSMSQSEKLKAMFRRIQGRRESLADYFYNKVLLCKDLELTLEEQQQEIAIGLWSRELSAYVSATTYKSLDELFQGMLVLKRVENGRRERAAARSKTAGSSSTGGSSNHSARTETSSAASTTTEGGAEPSVVKCYNCQSLWHFARECSSPRKELQCYRCQGSGHIAKICNQPRPQSKVKAAPINCVSVIENVNSSDIFKRQVNVGECEMNGTIDMGATVCTMKATIVLRESFEVVRVTTPLVVFGDHEITSPGIVTKILNFKGLSPRKIKFRIVPDDAQEAELILGRPFTEASDIPCYKVNNKLKFIQLPCSEDDNVSETGAVASDTTALAPGEIKLCFVTRRSAGHALTQ